ncbi:MAG: response regulator [Actinobacteria bacterium]|nr:response regulator [Actinomycetota bacterium]
MLFGRRQRTIRRILLVEDEPLVAFDNEHLLSEAGYEVVATVDSLADAARVIQEEDGLDLVLTDVTLSGDGDGTDVARAAAAKGIPVLFVTGNCPVEAQTLGVGCLAKPYSEKTLKLALEALDLIFRLTYAQGPRGRLYLETRAPL